MLQKNFWDQGKDYIRIPLKTLCHCTHNQEKSLIGGENKDKKAKKYIFKPKTKCGRNDQSIKIKRRRKIHVRSNENLFPGLLSWWGIHIKEWYRNDERGKQIKECVVKREKEKMYVAGYLRSVPTSRYGRNSFTISFQNLISCYKASRKDCKSGSVYLLKAGTLCYSYEHCYIIMVCMEEDRTDELKSFSSIYGEDIIEHNGCIDSEGKVTNPQITPYFRVQHLITDMYTKGSQLKFQYEEIGFAFYFKHQEDRLECKRSMIKERKVKHIPKLCVKRKFNGETMECPDV